jgi:hypothetical protein
VLKVLKVLRVRKVLRVLPCCAGERSLGVVAAGLLLLLPRALGPNPQALASSADTAGAAASALRPFDGLRVVSSKVEGRQAQGRPDPSTGSGSPRARSRGERSRGTARQAPQAPSPNPQAPDLQLFFQAASRDDKEASAALRQLEAAWRDDYAALIVDMARLMRPASRGFDEVSDEPLPPDDEVGGAAARPPDSIAPARPASSPQARVRGRLTRFLEKQTGRRFGDDLWAWREWIWSRPYEPHPGYQAFKGALYGQIDPRMAEFFQAGTRSVVRLDEVDWGGVTLNGIPPLGHPETIPAAQAKYLSDGNVVFGLVVNGEARAYPKRILAWHELARDRIGGVEMTIVYCTLCGTVIPYESDVGGVRRTFGTSGLLYRSNKLMFDRESMSLWSTLEGRPVIGQLAGADLQLRAHGIVTTTWGEWRAAHPDTTVLSLETGVKRDYSEGAAYREYFGTDDLMFRVSKTDRRLKNKAEVLVMRLAGEDGVRRPVAIAAEFLKKNPVYTFESGGRRFVVLTTPKGANRVYEAGAATFTRWSGSDAVHDAGGRAWRVAEEGLEPSDASGGPARRVPAQRAFWFAWYAQFPETVLIR